MKTLMRWLLLGLFLTTPAMAELCDPAVHFFQPKLGDLHGDLNAACAEEQLVASLHDFRVTLEAALRGGRNTLSDSYSPDHLARVSARKTIWDGPRFEAYMEAARLEAEARALQMLDARSQRRLTLMTRYYLRPTQRPATCGGHRAHGGALRALG